MHFAIKDKLVHSDFPPKGHGNVLFQLFFNVVLFCLGPQCLKNQDLQGAGVNIWHQLQYFKATIAEFACNMVTIPTLVLSVMFLEKQSMKILKTKQKLQRRPRLMRGNDFPCSESTDFKYSGRSCVPSNQRSVDVRK